MGSAGSIENRARKLHIRDMIDNFKLNRPCADCGHIYEPYCMDFDHLRDKFLSISQMIQGRYGLGKIFDEIDKCQLVCVLCHRARTHYRMLSNMVSTNQLSTHGKHFRKYQAKIKQMAQESKNRPCAICFDTFPFFQMEFDHLKNKIEPISVMISKRRPFAKIILEISKCQVLCSLCHRRKSIKEFELKWNNTRI